MLTFARHVDLATVATFVVAVVTGGLILVTYSQFRVSRRAFNLSIRPLLADPVPLSGDTLSQELIQFGAPGRDAVTIPTGSFYYNEEENRFKISVSFRNIGAGVAVIEDATTEPAISGDTVVSRKFVPVGESVRVNVSILLGLDDSERFGTQWWAMDGFAVSITYSDADGDQWLTSRAQITQAATHAPWVATISVSKKGASKPFVVGRSSV